MRGGDGLLLPDDDPLAVEATDAIHRGDVADLRRLLRENPGLSRAGIVTTTCSRAGIRTLLHVLTDWPAGTVNGPAIVAVLVRAGADVDASFVGGHAEKPLHWAASGDDVAVLDALLDAGADIEAGGGVVGNGTPLADAVAFGQWNAARRLVERGAVQTLWQAAALGDLGVLRERLAENPRPDEITGAFWCACHGGQRETAELLLAVGADARWKGYDDLTPIEAAERSGAVAVVEWLHSLGIGTPSSSGA